MVRPSDGIMYTDTYPYLLQALLGPQYHVVLRSRPGYRVVQLFEDYLIDDVLYNNSHYIILHLGLVDCAPRLFTLREREVLRRMYHTFPTKPLAFFVIQFKSHYRRFFTKYFKRTYASRKEFEMHYGAVIKEIKEKAKPKMLLITNIIDTNERNKFRSYNFEKNILEYNQILVRLVSANADICKLIDLFSATKQNKEFLLEEGTHLSKLGHDYLARALSREIKEERGANCQAG